MKQKSKKKNLLTYVIASTNVGNLKKDESYEVLNVFKTNRCASGLCVVVLNDEDNSIEGYDYGFFKTKENF